jgi:hypothetical protein
MKLLLVSLVGAATLVFASTAAASTYTVFGNGYWLHQNSQPPCVSCTVKITNNGTGAVNYTSTNSSGHWSWSGFQTGHEYHVLLEYFLGPNCSWTVDYPPQWQLGYYWMPPTEPYNISLYLKPTPDQGAASGCPQM